MQSNIDCIMDDLNDFPDSWIELHNTENYEISIKDYALGLSENTSESYMLPDVSIPSKGFILIFCDKKGKDLHADFRINSDEPGSIFLFNKEKDIIDNIDFLEMPAPNIAYGRETDGAENWCYKIIASPEKSNNDEDCSSAILSSPIFSVTGGVFTSKINLNLSLPSSSPSNAEIRYTIDGSEPTKSSLLVQKNEPITINSSIVIRAKIFADGCISIPSTTHSYIFHNREVTLPIISIVTDEEYLYDEKIGIYVEGTFSDNKNNFEYNWRRPINIEYFPFENKKAAFNQLAEMRIAGGYTRLKYSLKSLAVYSNKRFGTKHFKYNIWQDKPNIKIKSFLLRNAGNDFAGSYFRDAAIQTHFARYADIDWQAYQPAIFYLNGEYMGILNIRERSNEDNIFSNYNGLEDIDLIENWKYLKEGTWDNFNHFLSIYSKENISFETYESLMDIEEFINFFILNVYHANYDFPNNNCILWRPRKDGGKWRWIVKDVDPGWGVFYNEFQSNYLNFILREGEFKEFGNSEHATLLFRQLIKNKTFKDLFIDRFAVYMGDFFVPGIDQDFIDSLKNNIEFELPYFRQKYNHVLDFSDWNEPINGMRKWFQHRTPYMYSHLQDFFELGDLVPVVIELDESIEEKISSLSFNDIPIKNKRFDGKYFVGKTIRLESNSTKNIENLGWQVTLSSSNGKENSFIQKSSKIEYLVSAPYNKISFKAISFDDEGVSSYPTIFIADGVLKSDEPEEKLHIIVSDILGRIIYDKETSNPIQVELPYKGIYIVTFIGNNDRESRKIFY